MSVLLSEAFEGSSLPSGWSLLNGNDQATPHSGGHSGLCLELVNWGGYGGAESVAWASSDRVVVSVRFRRANAYDFDALLTLCRGSTLQLVVTATLGVAVWSYAAGSRTLIETTGTVVTDDAWHLIELDATLTESGSVRLTIDGTIVVDQTGLDLADGVTGATCVRLGSGYVTPAYYDTLEVTSDGGLPDANLSDGVLHAYSFDDQSQSLGHDAAGSLDLTGTASQWLGKKSWGAFLIATSGQSAKLTGTRGSAVTLTDGLTIAVWAKRQQLNGDAAGVAGVTDSVNTASDPRPNIFIAADGTANATVRTFTPSVSHTLTGPVISDTAYTLLVLRVSSVAQSFRVGGGEWQSQSVTLAGTSNEWDTVSLGFLGQALPVTKSIAIDECVLWDRVLTDAECDLLLNDGWGPAYYPWPQDNAEGASGTLQVDRPFAVTPMSGTGPSGVLQVDQPVAPASGGGPSGVLRVDQPVAPAIGTGPSGVLQVDQPVAPAIGTGPSGVLQVDLVGTTAYGTGPSGVLQADLPIGVTPMVGTGPSGTLRGDQPVASPIDATQPGGVLRVDRPFSPMSGTGPSGTLRVDQPVASPIDATQPGGVLRVDRPFAPMSGTGPSGTLRVDRPRSNPLITIVPGALTMYGQTGNAAPTVNEQDTARLTLVLTNGANQPIDIDQIELMQVTVWGGPLKTILRPTQSGLNVNGFELKVSGGKSVIQWDVESYETVIVNTALGQGGIEDHGAVIEMSWGSAGDVSLTDAFATVSGSGVITVTQANHGLDAATDTVVIAGSTAVGGLRLDGAYDVLAVLSSSQFTITHKTSLATSTATGGGTARVLRSPKRKTLTIGLKVKRTDVT